MDLSQLAYWNSQGEGKRFAHPLRLGWIAELEPDARILDYGCGYGRNLHALYERGFHNGLGVDFAEAMVERGRGLHPRLDLRVVDGPPLDEPDGSFDLVLLFAVLTCIPGDDDQQAVIDEACRLLRPGGLLYISDYPLQADARNLARYHAGLPRHGVWGVWNREDGGVFRHHESAWFEELLSEFEIERREVIETVTMGGNAAQALQILARRP
jgi:SAM-dependent methyltransferase